MPSSIRGRSAGARCPVIRNLIRVPAVTRSHSMTTPRAASAGSIRRRALPSATDDWRKFIARVASRGRSLILVHNCPVAPCHDLSSRPWNSLRRLQIGDGSAKCISASDYLSKQTLCRRDCRPFECHEPTFRGVFEAISGNQRVRLIQPSRASLRLVVHSPEPWAFDRAYGGWKPPAPSDHSGLMFKRCRFFSDPRSHGVSIWAAKRHVP
jgi:hypothetical protein